MRRLFLLLALFVLVSSAAAQGPNPKPPVAAHPETVRGAVAVSPGWLSMTGKWPAEENRLRMRLQTSLLAEAAARAGRALAPATNVLFPPIANVSDMALRLIL